MRGKLIKVRICEKTVAAILKHAGMCVVHQAHVKLLLIQKTTRLQDKISDKQEERRQLRWVTVKGSETKTCWWTGSNMTVTETIAPTLCLALCPLWIWGIRHTRGLQNHWLFEAHPPLSWLTLDSNLVRAFSKCWTATSSPLPTPRFFCPFFFS